MTKEHTRAGIMLDIETLGIESNAVVTQVAFVAFPLDDPTTTLRTCSVHLPIQPQLQLGRTVSASTLIWWMTQPKQARDLMSESVGNDMDELTALVWSIGHRVADVRALADSVEFWANGAAFDFPILESLMGHCGQEIPWHYREVRDLRTLLGLAELSAKDVPVNANLTPHIAIDDCLRQVEIYEFATRALRQNH